MEGLKMKNEIKELISIVGELAKFLENYVGIPDEIHHRIRTLSIQTEECFAVEYKGTPKAPYNEPIDPTFLEQNLLEKAKEKEFEKWLQDSYVETSSFTRRVAIEVTSRAAYEKGKEDAKDIINRNPTSRVQPNDE
jgi:hypothetical protein